MHNISQYYLLVVVLKRVQAEYLGEQVRLVAVEEVLRTYQPHGVLFDHFLVETQHQLEALLLEEFLGIS